MYSFFKRDRLLLTLIVLFGLFFGILGAVLLRPSPTASGPCMTRRRRRP